MGSGLEQEQSSSQEKQKQAKSSKFGNLVATLAGATPGTVAQALAGMAIKFDGPATLAEDHERLQAFQSPVPQRRAIRNRRWRKLGNAVWGGLRAGTGGEGRYREGP